MEMKCEQPKEVASTSVQAEKGREKKEMQMVWLSGESTVAPVSARNWVRSLPRGFFFFSLKKNRPNCVFINLILQLIKSD